MTGWICRIACKSVTTGAWSYKYLNVETFGMTSRDMIHKFNPLFMRVFGSIVTDTLGIQAKQFPSLMVDFMKWDEIITLKCYFGDGSTSTPDTTLATQYSSIRNWIMEKQLNVNNLLFLQLLTVNPTSTTDPQVKFDPIAYPLGVFPGRGYQGMVSDFAMESWEAGKNRINFSITWQCGIVVPI